MALSGVNQSHVQPVWAEIPSRSADIGAQAVPRALFLSEQISRIIWINLNLFGSALDNPSALPAQNLLADPVNSRVPSPDIQVEMGIFCSAACFGNGLLSIER